VENQRETGFLIPLRENALTAPLRCYLESPIIQRWLEQHAERRGDHWTLSEQTLKFIPIHKQLLEAVANPDTTDRSSSEIRQILATNPREAKKRAAQEEINATTRAKLFVHASCTINELRETHAQFQGFVAKNGRINWKRIIGILHNSHVVNATIHPEITISGNLPVNSPIARIERIKTPQPGFLFLCESGAQMMLTCATASLLDMLASQLEDLNHPTWNELVQTLRLPRLLEIAEAMASDILKTHGQQTEQLNDTLDFLSACSFL
jgi:hypothetical protein